MLFRRIRKRLSNHKTKIGVYALEVLLIILSVLLAIQADRYRQSRKDKAKLDNYVQALYQDLKEEQLSNQNNLADCRSDIASIEACLRLCRYDQNDSLQAALQHLKAVFGRGVFRAFPPTTYDVMTSSGDIALIKDLDFRKMLAITFSFRDNYIKTDLQKFDARTEELSHQIGHYFDLACLAASEELYPCLSDRTGFVEDTHNELFIFLRATQIRAFHLEVALKAFGQTIAEMERLYGLGEEG